MCVVVKRSHSRWWSFWICRCDGHLLDDVRVQRPPAPRLLGPERRGQHDGCGGSCGGGEDEDESASSHDEPPWRVDLGLHAAARA